MTPSLRRRIFAVLAGVAALVLAGATYQGVATAFERREFPHPGRLIDIGGHQLHVNCTGDGSPTVVLEAPATAMSAVWGWVQPAVAAETRVCSYDRAGLGWSEAGDGVYEPAFVPHQLNTLLDRAGEHGPFVLVGAQLGAAFVRRYTTTFPTDTVALVLVDDPAASGGASSGFETPVASPWLARTGLLRATRMWSREPERLPAPAAGALRAFLNRPDHLTRSAQETARWRDAVGERDGAASAATAIAVPTRRVTTSMADPVLALQDRAEAAAIVAAILATVEDVR